MTTQSEKWSFFTDRIMGGFSEGQVTLEIKAPFKDFQKSNFYQPKKLSNKDIKSIGLVAAFDDSYADVRLVEIDFY